MEDTSFQQEIHVPERFLKREQERLHALEKRQEERQDKESDGFSTTFNDNSNRIKAMIEELAQLDKEVENKEVMKDKFADINKQLLLLNRVILDGKIFLASYDMKAYNSKLMELTEQCNSLEAKLLPRKKFGFRKTKPVVEAGTRTTPVVNEPIAKDIADFGMSQQIANIGFYSRKNETLQLACEDVHKKPISLCDLENCTVRIQGNPSAVHMNNISKCRILLGPVSNSVHIENCTETTLSLACHQFRMHTSDSCKLFLHCASQPVIEYCKSIGFAPLLTFDEDMFVQSGLNRKNLWDQVQDFNWLSNKERSPNWFIIEEEEREKLVFR